MDIVQVIIDRAVSDPDFMKRFMLDPVGLLEEEGIDLSAVPPEDLQAIQKAAGRSLPGLVETLQQRISRMGITGTPRLPGSH